MREPALSEMEEEKRLRHDWKLFTAVTFLFAFGLAIYIGDFQNFLRDRLGSDPLMLGGLESLREIPGLLAALLAGTLVALAETRIAALGLFVASIGIGLSGSMPTYTLLVGITIFWSVGFHTYYPASSAITLALAKGREAGRHLGRMTSVSKIATVAALAAAWALAKGMGVIGYKSVHGHAPGQVYQVSFMTAGLSIGMAAICCLFLSHRAATQGPRSRLIIRREYSLYYLLTFLDGCRRQIFSIFASFALVLVYRVPLTEMLLIQLVNALIIMLFAPSIGRLMDRHGERGPLTFYSIGLIVIFLGYATMRTVGALVALFLIDNLLFSFSVGFTTYLHRIVRKNELTPCLSMGVTMNHIAAVTVPVGGAWLWQYYGNYQIPFWVGVAVAVISLIATRWLPTGSRGGGVYRAAE